MEKKQPVHNLIILDESGSMASIKSRIISGFNELVQTMKASEEQFPDQEHFISLVSFNGMGQKIHHFIDPVRKLEEIDDSRYQPNYSTPLYDAMGFALNKLHQVLKSDEKAHVLVTIMTDGEENASKEFSGREIRKMVEGFKAQRWVFTYIGTDHDVEQFAASIAINNTLNFAKTSAGMDSMFAKEKSARMMYFSKVNESRSVDDGDFYADTPPQ